MMVKYLIDPKVGHTSLNPTTLAPELIHPIVYFDIDTMKVDVRPEVRKWMDDTMPDRYNVDMHTVSIDFKLDSDLTMFTLKWCGK